MLIEVKGIGIPNKGAELMLVAIQQAVGSAIDAVEFASEPYTDYKARARYGLYQKAWLEVKKRQIGPMANVLPKRLLGRFGIVRDIDVDVILDASGFAYGDQWGAYKLKSRLGKHIRSWKKNGKKVVLLPQAFGPFSSPEIRTEISRVLQHADLVFARDQQSYQYLQEFLPNSTKLILAPDFTNLVTGKVPASFPQGRYDVCVIPNNKMIEMQDAASQERYPKFMAQLIEVAQSRGKRPFLLIHEGVKDLKLAEKINSLLAQPLEILSYEDPVEIKGVIGTADIVISSRFHGLVSALSQGVPVIATGWSHKYQELLQDYGCPELLVDYRDGNGTDRLRQLCDRQLYEELRRKIQDNALVQKKKTQEMWQVVLKAIA